jgi:hypothetical protein
VAVVAAIAVGAYLVIGGGSGGSDIADDGAHKLATPATILDGEYKKGSDTGIGGMTKDDINDAESWGVKNPKGVSAGYTAGSGLTSKNLVFAGVYGTIDNPEKVVDEMFSRVTKEAGKGADSGKAVGSPKEFKPTGFKNGVMKCQEIQTTESGQTVTMPFCIWADHSTVTYVVAFDVASLAKGQSTSMNEAAELTAKVRNDVRVKA